MLVGERTLKEQIRDANRSLARLLTPHQRLGFFCECDEGNCRERITVERDVYLALSAREAGFVVAPHHAAGIPDHVVIHGDGYAVLRPIGA